MPVAPNGAFVLVRSISTFKSYHGSSDVRQGGHGERQVDTMWCGPPGDFAGAERVRQPLDVDVHFDEIRMLFLCEDAVGVL